MNRVMRTPVGLGLTAAAFALPAFGCTSMLLRGRAPCIRAWGRSATCRPHSPWCHSATRAAHTPGSTIRAF